MPRTKHVRKPKQERVSLEESDLLVRDFERQAQARITKMEAEIKMEIKSLETFIEVTLSRLPIEIQKMTLGEILGLQTNNGKENFDEIISTVDDVSFVHPSTMKTKKTSKRITTASDDGYVTEGVATVSRPSRVRKTKAEPATSRRTRSSSRNSRRKLSEVNESMSLKTIKKESKRSTQMDKFKTPASKYPNNEFGLVTPKVKPNTPLNVLRRPRQGEMVLSMQGSPLLVSAVVKEDIANINVPLLNGNVMSLLPNDGLRMSSIPTLDPETMRQLETLKGHIEKVIASK